MNRQTSKRRRSRFIAAFATAGLLALPTLGWAQQDDALRLRLPGGEPEHKWIVNFLNNEATDSGEENSRWIGVQVTELPELLRSHLKLDHGVLVEDVLADAPAAEAGVKTHDVLLEVDGKKITRPEDVRDAVEAAAEGAQIKFKVLHAGDEKSLHVVPTARPVDRVIINPTATPSGAASSQQEFLKHQHQALKALERALADRQAAGMMFMRPGIVTQKPVELPKDVTVNIMHRLGQKTIIVQRGDKTWEVTEDSLDKLPEDLRGPVASLLHCHVPLAIRSRNGGDVVRVLPDGSVRGDIRIDAVPPRVQIVPPSHRDSEKLDAVLKELKGLRKQVDELQRRLPKDE